MAKDMFSGTTNIDSLINTIKAAAAEALNGKKVTDELTTSLKKAEKAIKDLGQESKRLTDAQNLTKQLRELKDIVSQLQVAMSKTTTQTKQFSSGLNSMKEAIKATGLKWGDFGENFKQVSSKIDSSGNSIAKYTDNLNRTVTITGKVANGTKTYTATLEKSNSVVQKAAKVEKQVGNEIQQTTKHIKNQAFATDNWAYNWSKAMQSFLTYNTVTQFFNTIMNGIKDMIEKVKELDDALVELQKVTDLEGKELEEFTDRAYQAGETVAKTGTEMIEAATSFAKAGYKDEALELGTIAAMYTNIADEAISSADAADMIIAQMKAFKIEAQDAIHIIDAINEVSNNYAVSSADIANNLGKASAVMANAGNSMEQYIGLMTAATEVTRNASKAANGLKTLTLRLQGMNDEGEKDLEVQSQIEALFQKLGISVYKTNGELKNTYEILETLAPAYQKLTNAEKAYVTETIAGKYQAQNAAAILNNWQTAVDATTTAMNSNGSAAKENEKVLQSIQGRLQSLKSAWEKFAKDFISSDFIKSLVDLGTMLIKIVDSDLTKFILKFGALYIVLKKGSSIFNALTLAIKTNKLANSNLLKSLVLLTKGEKGLEEYLKKNQKNYDKLSAKKKKQIMDNQKEQAAILKTQLKYAALSLVITAVIGAMDAYAEHQRKILEQARELEATNATEAKTSYDKYKSDSESLDEQITKYKELKKSLTEEQHTLSEQIEIKGQIYDIQKDIVDKYGEQASGVDLVNGKLEDQLGILGEINTKNAENWLKENSAKIQSSKTALSRQYMDNNKEDWLPIGLTNGSAAESMGEMIGADEYGRITGGFTKWLQTVGSEIVTLGDSYREYGFKFKGTAEEVRQELEYALKLLDDKNWTSQFDLKEQDIEVAKKVIQTKINEIDSFIKEHQEVLNEYAEALAITDDKYREKYGKFLEAQKDYEKSTLEGDTKGIADAEKRIGEFQTYVEGLTDDPIMKNYFESLLSGWSKQIQNSDIDKQIENKQWKIDESIKKLNSLNLNADSIKELGKIYKDNTWNLNDYDFETYQALENFAKAAAEANVPLDEFIDRLEQLGLIAPGATKQTEDAKNAITTYSGELKTLVEDLKKVESAYETLKSAQEEYNETGGLSLNTLLSLLEMEPKYLQYLIDENGQLNLNEESMKNLAEAKLIDAKASIISTAMKELDIVYNNKDAEAVEKLKLKYESLKTKIDETGTAYEGLAAKALEYKSVEGITDEQKGLMDDIVANAKRNIDAIDKLWNGSISRKSGSGGSSSSSSQKEWWEKELDALKDQYNNSEITVEQYINSLTNLLGKVQQGTEAWKKINQELYKQKLDKIKDDYNAGRISLNQYIISLQNLQKEYKAGTKAWNELADAIKKAKLDKLKEQQDDLKSALSAVNNVLEKQINEYEDLKQAADDRYNDELDKLNELQDSLNDSNDDYERAQKAVVQFLNEQLDAIKEQKDTVETYYDDVISAIEKMNKDTQESIELAEAYDALMNAMTQKTKKVYKEGLGWIWTTDAEAIKDAKKTYEDLLQNATTKEIEEQKDKTVKSLEEQIESLQDYIDSWDKVFDKFDNEKNRNLADILLGENWTEMVSNLDPQIVEDFTDAYYDLQKNLDETSKQIDELNKKKEEEDEYWDKLIKDLQDYKGEWSDIASVYEEAQNALKAKQIMGANWEKEILDRRLDVLENFKNKYNAILAEIDKVDNMSTDQASGYTALRLPGYANGGEVDYTGLAVLHGTPNKPEYVLNNSQMRNLLGNLTRPRTTSIINNKSGAVVNNYSFGDIELPNVTNAQQFANELKSMLNITKNQ